MNETNSSDEPIGTPSSGLSTASAIPSSPSRLGSLLPAVSGAWSQHEQTKMNRFFAQWMKMLEDEIREKEATVIEIMARLDMQDEKISLRVDSKEYQSLLKKTFREWSGAESESKRVLIRNILSNAACSNVSSDDVVRMFIDWINGYSELHFQVIGAIYNADGISRGGVWRKIGKGPVREDSADADLYKLLFRDLSTGGIVRQHREKDYEGNYLARSTKKSAVSGAKTLTSAFDEEDQYELTELGRQFVHYAMTELTSRIEFRYQTD